MALTPRSEFDKLVRFERATQVGEAMGGTRPGAWSLIERAWAKVTFGPAAERREAGAQNASQAATFRVLSTTKLREVTAQDRIVWRGNWNIVGDAHLRGEAGEIEFTAVLSKG